MEKPPPSSNILNTPQELCKIDNTVISRVKIKVIDSQIKYPPLYQVTNLGCAPVVPYNVLLIDHHPFKITTTVKTTCVDFAPPEHNSQSSS